MRRGWQPGWHPFGLSAACDGSFRRVISGCDRAAAHRGRRYHLPADRLALSARGRDHRHDLDARPEPEAENAGDASNMPPQWSHGPLPPCRCPQGPFLDRAPGRKAEPYRRIVAGVCQAAFQLQQASRYGRRGRPDHPAPIMQRGAVSKGLPAGGLADWNQESASRPAAPRPSSRIASAAAS